MGLRDRSTPWAQSRGARILLAAVALFSQIGGPAALEALPSAHCDDGRVVFVLVASARLDAKACGELRFVETQGEQPRLGGSSKIHGVKVRDIDTLNVLFLAFPR